MRQYPEQLADGRKLYREALDSAVLGPVDTLSECVRGACSIFEGSVKASFRLVEGTIPEGTLGVVEGVAAKSDIINKNRRLYSKEVYELAIGRAQALIKDAVFLGEVDHPGYGSLGGGAFRFTKLWMDEGLVRFEGVILDTDGGRHLKGLIKGGVGVQVSTRGYASATFEKRTINGVEIDIAVIGKDLTFEGIDFVLFASNIAGRVTSAKTESADNADVTTEAGMTLADIREKHADLVAQIEAAAREGYVAQADVAAQVEAAKTAERAAVVAENAANATALAAVLAAVKPLIPAQTTEAQAAEVADLRGKLEAVTTERNTLASEKQAAETAKQEAERVAEAQRVAAEKQAAITAKVDEVLKDYINADLVRDELLKAESVEDVAKLFESRKTLMESAAARAGVKPGPKGEGKTDQKSPADQTSPAVVDEVTRRQRKIAGLDESK